MPVEFLWSRVQYPVKLEHGHRVLQLEAARQHRQPLLNLGTRVLGSIAEIADLVLALDLLHERVELTQRVLGAAPRGHPDRRPHHARSARE